MKIQAYNSLEELMAALRGEPEHPVDPLTDALTKVIKERIETSGKPRTYILHAMAKEAVSRMMDQYVTVISDPSVQQISRYCEHDEVVALAGSLAHLLWFMTNEEDDLMTGEFKVKVREYIIRVLTEGTDPAEAEAIVFPNGKHFS